jgi:O6-methylguanine-DNA--protein-cysteine methyltransferase
MLNLRKLISQSLTVEEAAGNILRRNYNFAIPCHRVIRANGDVGGYNRGRKNKIKILKKEKYEL